MIGQVVNCETLIYLYQ